MQLYIVQGMERKLAVWQLLVSLLLYIDDDDQGDDIFILTSSFEKYFRDCYICM